MMGRYISNDIGSVSSVEIFPKEEVLSLTKLYVGEAYSNGYCPLNNVDVVDYLKDTM